MKGQEGSGKVIRVIKVIKGKPSGIRYQSSNDPVSMSYLDNITRPTLLVHEGRCRANIRRIAEKARSSGVIFRPHFKTHQSAAIGEWFREEGVNAITVSSVGMADYFAQSGWSDITIAFPVNLRETEEIRRLAGRINLNLLVNSSEVAAILQRELPQRMGVFVEIDTGYHRSGLAIGQTEEVKAIQRVCLDSGTLEFKGLLSHFGNTYQATDREEVSRIYLQGVGQLEAIRRQIDPGGELILSIGDTPSCSLLESFPGVNEVRPGNFVFYDAMQLWIGACSADQVAVCLAAPVVDLYPARQEAVVHAGAIHLSKERVSFGGEEVFGLVVRLTETGWTDPIPGCSVKGLSQEHGILRLDAGTLKSLHAGDLIGILPVHSCLTADAMKHYTTLSGNILSAFTGE